MRFHPLPVIDLHPETDDTVSVSFGIPDDLSGEFDFTQGQHLTLRREFNQEEVRRSYSIASSSTRPIGAMAAVPDLADEMHSPAVRCSTARFAAIAAATAAPNASSVRRMYGEVAAAAALSSRAGCSAPASPPRGQKRIWSVVLPRLPAAAVAAVRFPSSREDPKGAVVVVMA